MARQRVIMSTPALAAQTWTWRAMGTKACGAEMLMRLPPGRRMCGCAAFITWKVPRTSMSMTALKPPGLMSAASAGKLPAAPETRTSMGPVGVGEGRDRRGDGLGIAHVEDVAAGAGAESGEGGLDLLRAAAADAEPGAGGGEGAGDAEVDAAGAAGDEDVAAGIVEARLLRRPGGAWCA